MTNWYCTLFDSHYLVKGLAMIRSLQATGENFRLVVYCFDDLAFKILSGLKIAELELIRLKDFETAELLKVKPTRNIAEYCWTCTPFVLLDSLKRYSLDEITYIDADVLFYAKPELLLNELRSSGNDILLTEHRYTPQYEQSKTSGIYCVQFMTFKRTDRGMKALQWWADRCLEWCFARYEDGKLGDQKYLDDWTKRFEGVHVLEHLGGGVAPWNVQQYKITSGPRVDDVPVVFYHFHRLRMFENGKFDLCDGAYILSKDVIREIYYPYIRALRAALTEVQKIDPSFTRSFNSNPNLKDWSKRVIKGILKGNLERYVFSSID